MDLSDLLLLLLKKHILNTYFYEKDEIDDIIAKIFQTIYEN